MALTAALKPRDVPIFTFPPEWFPTQYWNWSSFSDALFAPKQPFLRYVLNTFMLVGLTRSAICCRLRWWRTHSRGCAFVAAMRCSSC